MIDTSQELILKNSVVYDVKNKIDGEKKDLLICDGKFVDSLKDEQSAKVLDTNGCVTFPGFIDLRSHVFAQETVHHQVLSHSYNTRLEHSVVEDIEQNALNSGFTFLCEMDVPITQSKITLHNMQLSQMLDHLMILDIGSNWSFFGDLESDSAVENIGNTMSMLLGLVKGYGISTNCPYHQQYWKLNEIPHDSKIPMMNLTLKQAYDLFSKAAIKNNIAPHFLSPYHKEDSSIDHIQTLNEIDQSNFTLSTVNQYFPSEFSEFVKYHSSHEQFSCEITPFSLGFTHPLITRDRNLAIRESRNSGIPITTMDLEFDTEFYVTGRKLEKNHPYLVKWKEMVRDLKSNSDLNRVVLSSNFPYHMSVSDWSNHLFELITSSESSIGLLDICGLLSANPAKLLNMEDKKGKLSAGADADIVCFNMNPEQIENTSFSNPKFVIKNGQVIKKDFKLTDSRKSLSKIYWRDGKYNKDKMEKIKKIKEKFYEKRFSMYLNTLENEITPTMEKH